MVTRVRRVGVAGVSIVGVLALSACNPGAAGAPPAGGAGGTSGAAASGPAFSKELSGSLKTSGYNPSDEVGKSRSDLATASVKPVEVTMDTTNFDPQKFAAQAASGQVPDLIQVNRNAVGTLADKGLIVPLDDCYALYGVKPAEQYYPAAIKDVTYDGKVYGFPQFFQASMLIGNKTVMDAAGVTAAQLDTSKPDQLIAAAQKMAKAAGGKPTVWASTPTCPARQGSGSPCSAAPRRTQPASPRWTRRRTSRP